MSEKKRNKKILTGVVISNKMLKTVVVRVQRIVKNPVFHKYIKQYKKYKAHDENNFCQIGDHVSLIECRPLSKDKKWRISQILKKAK